MNYKINLKSKVPAIFLFFFLFFNISHADDFGLLNNLLQRYFNTRQTLQPIENIVTKLEPKPDTTGFKETVTPRSNPVSKEGGYCSGKRREIEKKLDEKSSVYDESNWKYFLYEYKVIGDGKIKQISGKNDPKMNDLMNKLLQIIPDKILNQYIDSFRVEESDLARVAAVNQSSTKNKFVITLNKKRFDESPIINIFAIVHEMGHIVAKRDSQVGGSGLLNKVTCKTLTDSDLNCYRQDSLLYKFKKAFYNHGDNKNSGSKDEKDYVSDYAKSGGYMEDFAESFRFYVLDTDLTKEKSGEAYAKIEFFRLNQNSGELNMEELKKDIRAKVGGSSFCNY